MERILIKNIGPIEDADIELNRINLFIGPQSSGKSTIAKLVSFCQWLEKYIIVNQSKKSITSEFLRRKLILYHGFSQFLSESSFLEYDSDMITFKFHSLKNFSIDIKGDISKGLMRKIAYIPSERNVVSLPNVSSFQMVDNYIRSFVFDWLTIRTKYGINNHYSVLNLDVDYYFDGKNGDIVKLKDGKEITLSESSSGLQAVIPLLIYVNYITKWIYANDADISYNNYTSLQKALLKELTKGRQSDNVIEMALKDEKIKKQVNDLLRLITRVSSEVKGYQSNITGILERLGRPHSTKLTIEECEMNLFPSTQYILVQKIIGAMNFKRGDSLLLTTHSPYIMTSINNLIQAKNAAKEEDADLTKISSIIPKESWIDYSDVSAWAVEKGRVASINDDDDKIISSDDLDRASEEISDDYSNLI
jgi:predicted ATPase